MDELIKINVRETDDGLSVSAREFHKGLGVTERFQSWFKRKIESCFLEKGTDYEECIVWNEKARQNLVDYQISLEAAKHICMTQQTLVAKQYRDHLLKVEKAWNSPDQVIARAQKIADKRLQEMQLLLETNAPKIAFAEAVEIGGKDTSIGTMAKLITQRGRETIPGFKIGERELFRLLREKGILASSQRNRNMPASEYTDKGYFKIKAKKYPNKEHTSFVPVVTGKGQIWLMDYVLKVKQGVN